MHTSYPESAMKVAAHVGNGVVKIYGHEHNGFRPYESTHMAESVPAAISYCHRYNDEQRRKLGLKVSS